MTTPPVYIMSNLPSGLTVVSAARPGSRAMSAAIVVRAGSAYEDEDHAGWMHLLEHLHLSGDASDGRTHRRIAALKGYGALFNARTTHEATIYTLGVARRYWREASCLVAEGISAPIFTTRAIARERQVVLQETSMLSARGGQELGTAVASMLYAGTPFARGPLLLAGDATSLSRATPGKLASYRVATYATGNALIIVVGAIDHADALAFAERIDLPVGEALADPVGTWEPMTGVRRIATSSTQSSLVLAWPTVPSGHPDSTALALISVYLGNGMGGRLFTELRARRGLTYAPSNEHVQFPTVGALEFWMETSDPAAADEATAIAIDLIENDWQTLTPRIMTALRREMLGIYDLATDTPIGLLNVLADTYAGFRRIQQPDEVVVKLRALDLDEVIRVWRRYLTSSSRVVVREN